MVTAVAQRPRSGRNTPPRAQPPSGTRARAARKTPAPTNVVPLRDGDQHRKNRSNYTCRHCGGAWFDAVVTLDRANLRPGVAMTYDGARPTAKCHQCGREARFDE